MSARDATAADPLAAVRPAIRALDVYALETSDGRVKLDQNESPFELPDAFKRRVAERLLAASWRRYPGVRPEALAAGLAERAGWRADGVLVGHGSNSLIGSLLTATVAPGQPVVVPRPTFSLYAHHTRVVGGEPLEVDLDGDFGFDVAALEAARRDSRAPVTLISSPNNPTGAALDLAALARLAAAAPGLLVIDEAYHEFSGVSAVPLLAEHANVVVLRTLSKAAALAGLRIGYLLAAPALVEEVAKVQVPYSIDLTAEIAALELLADPALLEPFVARVVALRGELFAALARQPGVRPYASAANFVLFELLRHDARAVHRRLALSGVRVRNVTGYHRLGRCLRVGVGTREDNQAFLAALADGLSAAHDEETR